MPKLTKPLTNTEVKQARPRDKVYTLSDGEGLQLRVKPNGSKLWLLDYRRPYTKKRTSLSFGSYPDLTIAEARKKRTEARALLAKNIDPKEYREEQSRISENAFNNTLEYIARQWLEVKKATISADHATDTQRSLELHIFPDMGNVPIHKITAMKAIDTLKPIAAKGNLETIKRLCQRLNEIMVYAVNTPASLTATRSQGSARRFKGLQTTSAHTQARRAASAAHPDHSQHQTHHPLPNRVATPHNGEAQ